MTSSVSRHLPPGLTLPSLALRALLLVLPCAALALALPERPHVVVVVLVVLCSALWARVPDHLAGAVSLALVVAWWTVHDVLDWRILVVGVLLLAAHVVATLLSYGPDALAVDPRLARLWLARGLLALVPLPVTWLALRGLDADLAPPWLWMTAAVATGLLLAVTSRLMQAEGHDGLLSDVGRAARTSGPGAQ
ncbi:hypothetical protein [Nocardioides zhouii]|uniref:Uncharacterized protein n=1 Tax=Nocardioides zhouii TaxID=1168729 RepID=A0A4Q2SSI8_9ACTN|nr:hypothetical protein [Nocardioides zhouii]RYC07228.1 hypothetical protein EUA94_15165 [Nocardioides zhouii]